MVIFRHPADKNQTDLELAFELAVAEKLGPAGRALVQPANDAFIHAMHITAMGSAAVALRGGVVVLRFLPRKAAAVAADGERSQRQTVGAQR